MIVITQKQIKKWAAIIIIVATVIILALPIGYAGIYDFPSYMLSVINEGVINVIRDNLTYNDGANAFYAYMVRCEEFNGVNAIKVVANSVKVVSGFIIILLAFARYFQNLEKGKEATEGIYEMMAEICLVGMFMINIDLVLEWIVMFGEWFIDIMLSLVQTPAIPAATLESIVGDSSGGALWLICSFMILSVPWLLSLGLQVVAQWIAFSLLIEIGIRKAFAPFAVCEIYGEGLRSPGVRYLKRFLATFLKVAIALLTCYLGSVLTAIAITDNLTNVAGNGLNGIVETLQFLFRVIAINFTVIGVIMKGGEYANDIVGVGP